MNMIEGIQFILGIGFLLVGLFMFAVELIGVFKFKYVLNRMHAAAMGDTIGLGLCLVGLIILCGFNYTSLKMALIIVFLWLASPVSSHLIARLEVTTNEEIEKFCERRDLELKKRKSAIKSGNITEKIESNQAVLENSLHEQTSKADCEDVHCQIRMAEAETEEKSLIKKSQSKAKTKMQTKKNKKGKGKR